MNDMDKQKRLDGVDDILAEVRRELQVSQEPGEVYELKALQLLLQVVKSLHSLKDIYALIGMILDSALSFAEADRAFLMMIDSAGEPRFKMGRSYEGENLSEGDFTITTGVVQEALHSLKPIIVADASNDAQFSKRQSVVDLKLRTVMAAPLRYRQEVPSRTVQQASFECAGVAGRSGRCGAV
jgi:transcriptional regulator with GAF, ATPase, and Fis domain